MLIYFRKSGRTPFVERAPKLSKLYAFLSSLVYVLVMGAYTYSLPHRREVNYGLSIVLQTAYLIVNICKCTDLYSRAVSFFSEDRDTLILSESVPSLRFVVSLGDVLVI